MPEYIDETGRSTWTYSVYMIELRAAACFDTRATCRGCDPVPVYVGQSAHEPKHRFDQHRRGVHASYWVRKYGRWVRWRLFRNYPEFSTQEEALVAEARLGKKLRRQGYCVYGAH